MNGNERDASLARLTLALLCAALLVGAAVFAMRRLLPVFLPFLLGWSAALVTKPLAERLQKHTRLSERASAVLVVALLAFAVVALLIFFGAVLLREAKELYGRLSQDTAGVERAVESAADAVRRFLLRLPLLGKSEAVRRTAQDLEGRLAGYAASYMPQVVAFLTAAAGRIASSVPQAVVALFVTVLSAFYFAADRRRIHTALSRLVPRSGRGLLFRVKIELFSVTAGYFRAYALVLAVTFTELLVGFSIIGVEYALLAALLIALVDLLPVLGTGTVLLPWGALSLYTGQVRRGVCLLVLYAVVTVLRQILEPKIVGSFIGLHPLATLFSMYVGARFFGLTGLVLAPIAVITARNVAQKRRAQEKGGSVLRTP